MLRPMTVSFDVATVTGCLGAELRGVDLRAMDDSTFAAVEHALVEHEVVFVRDMHLTEDEQLALGARFGALNVFPMAKMRGATQPAPGVFVDTPESPPVADAWHTDVTWIATPPDVAILCLSVAAERGGDTMWSSMTAAYDALSPTMQDLICGLRVRHDNTSFIRGMLEKMPELDVPGGVPDQLRAAYPPVEHPLVRTHPVSGRRALYLGGGFMRGIVGMHQDESDALLGFLQAHAGDAGFVCGWHWRSGDVAIWDERSTNHRAAGGPFVGRREMRRVECGGAVPVFVPEAPAWPRATVTPARTAVSG
jgi:taurine dioxygenase